MLAQYAISLESITFKAEKARDQNVTFPAWISLPCWQSAWRLHLDCGCAHGYFCHVCNRREALANWPCRRATGEGVQAVSMWFSFTEVTSREKMAIW